jgi:hypothetical protein
MPGQYLVNAYSTLLQAKTVTARNVVTGEQRSHAYNALVLSPGAAALKPPLPGVDLPGIFSVKTIPDRYIGQISCYVVCYDTCTAALQKLPPAAWGGPAWHLKRENHP